MVGSKEAKKELWWKVRGWKGVSTSAGGELEMAAQERKYVYNLIGESRTRTLGFLTMKTEKVENIARLVSSA